MEKIREARRAAERQDFAKAESALRYVVDEAARSGDGDALAEVRVAAAALATTAWGRWQRHFAALASEVEDAAAASPSRPEWFREVDSSSRPSTKVPAAEWVSACVVLFAIAAALSALGGLIVFFDQVSPDPVAGVTGLIVGLVAAALWIGLAVALVLLRDIATVMRDLASRT